MNVTIDSSTINLIVTTVQNTFASLLPIIAIVTGVPLAFYVVRKIITLIPKR